MVEKETDPKRVFRIEMKGAKNTMMLEVVTVALFFSFICVGGAESDSSRADLTFSILEEQSVGTYVGSITESPALYRNMTSAQRQQLSYGLLDQSRYPASLFRVDESSGDIFVASRVDRESEECYRQSRCQLEFNVALSSARIVSNIATVLVKVVDKNDNPPYFPAQPSGGVLLQMSEVAPVGTVLKVSGAVDRDQDTDNTIKRYALTAYSSVFSISSSQNLDGSSVLDLTLLLPLDRETLDTYLFSILAFDGGSPPLSAELNVEIEVTDENDNPPVFMKTAYNVEIRDEVGPGQVIVRLSASDPDKGQHGEVRFQFSSLQRQQMQQLFHVDEVTGVVSAVSDLAPGEYQFIVEALDGGSPRLMSQTVVTVTVISSRNNPPFLQINTLSNGSNSFVEIPEDAGPGTFVAFVTAEDSDEGNRGEITCQLNGDVLSLDTLAGKGYTLTLRSALDREKRDTYNITVSCSDQGQPPLTSTKSLLVVVTDVNDKPPQFTWNTFSHTVPEGNYSNRHIIQVTATDQDMGRNAELVYSIDRSAKPPFTIDPVTGIVSASGQLDREKQSTYSFHVYASDRGSTPLTATANVVITLEDVNDQYPTFSRSIFEYRIPEDAPKGTVLGTLTAYDKDDGLNARFEFFYAGSLDGADPFVVEPNGTIWSSGVLDRERRDSYSFTVMVRDKGIPPKTTYASAVVTVLDINDNDPLIRFPVAGNHTIHISSLPESGMVLAKIVAHDPDAAENGSLQYLVITGNEDNALDIDRSGGEVKVKDVSRLKNRSVYKVVVGVRDYGLPPRSSNTTILVEVNFDNSSNVLLREQGGEEEKSEDYVLIVAGVAGITVVLSAIIVMAICFIFRQDRQYRGKHAASTKQVGDDGELFNAVPCPQGNLSDDDKLRPSLEEEGDDDRDDEHSTSLNDKHDLRDDFKKQLATDTFRNSMRKKEVTFAGTCPVAEEGGLVAEAGSPMSHTYRNAASLGVVGGGDRGEMLRHHHGLINRQMDEVGSDTSGDTGTSDSGRGGSEDDVNIDHILHGGDRERQVGGQVVPSVQPSMDNERYTRFPPPRTPKGDSKPYHVRFDVRTSPSRDPAPTNQRPSSRASNPPHDCHSANQRTVARGSSGPSLFSPRTSRDGPFSSGSYRDVSFTALPQHSPQRTLSTFTSPQHSPPGSFTTFHTSHRGPSQQSATSMDDDASTTTSGSYTVSPEELRVDGYIGTDVIV